MSEATEDKQPAEENNNALNSTPNEAEGLIVNVDEDEGVVNTKTVPRKDGRADKGAQRKGRPDRNNQGGSGYSEDDSGFIEKVVSIKRITKVTKGGKKLSFSALVVVGDTKGNVGYSLSKASEVSAAIRKAMGVAKKNMIPIPMRGSTITHEIIGECGGARVLLKPASDGTGVIASGPVRAVCDGAGIHNILTKCHRSNNPINVVKATMNGLTRLKPVIKSA